MPRLHQQLPALRRGVGPDLGRAAEVGVLARMYAAERVECRRRLRSGAWTSYGPVVVTHNGPLTDEQAEWVALLRAGDGAVLAAVSAMRRHGLRIDAPVRPQIVVPANRTVPRFVHMDVRRSRLLGPLEVHPVRQPPMLRLARATLDAASLVREPDGIRSLLCLPVQHRALRVPELRTALLRLGPHAGRALMLRTLDDLELGAQTVHEQAFTRLVRRAGLPEPDRQVLRQSGDGRRYLDAAWLRYRVHVEIDGLAHMWVDQWTRDLDRSNELEITRSECRLRFPGHRLLECGPQVVDQLRRALLAGGWQGSGA